MLTVEVADPKGRCVRGCGVLGKTTTDLRKYWKRYVVSAREPVTAQYHYESAPVLCRTRWVERLYKVYGFLLHTDAENELGRVIPVIFSWDNSAQIQIAVVLCTVRSLVGIYRKSSTFCEIRRINSSGLGIWESPTNWR